MTDTVKPRVATVLVLGFYHGPKFIDYEPTIFGQTRGYYNPKTGAPLKGSPGERSIFGEHFKAEEDGDTLDTAVRCAGQEFWLPTNMPLGRGDFLEIAKDIETASTINDLFLLNRLVWPEQIGNGEGDGLLHIPIAQLDWYVRDKRLTEASLATLKYCDVLKLFETLERQEKARSDNASQ